jgi:hypothetical protein
LKHNNDDDDDDDYLNKNTTYGLSKIIVQTEMQTSQKGISKENEPINSEIYIYLHRIDCALMKYFLVG